MQDIFRSQFRLPVELADKLRESAEASNRSMNAEVVARLEDSFSSRPASNDVKLAMDTYLATLENQAAMAEMRIQMARMQLDSLYARTHQLVHRPQKDVAQMSNQELEAAEREVEELKAVEVEIAKFHRELKDLQRGREAVVKSISDVRAAIQPKIKDLEEALATRPKKADSF